jgi:enoyl-CoA hydratase/carnithine racemase
MSSDADIIEYRKADHVGILTMRHAPHNLVGKAFCGALIAALHAAQADGCRALVLRSGLRHFSAGADMELFANGGERMHELDATGVLRAFDELPIPIVGSVHGVALGGGFELALACDIVIAAASSKFGLVEATLGLHPLMGGIQRVMQRAGAARAKEIVMLGRRHDAATLEKWGIVNRVVPDAKLEEVTLSLARELAQGPTVAHAATKRLSNIYLDQGMRASDAMMAEVQQPIFASGDLQRGLDSFKASGPGNAVFQGN